MKTGYKLYYTRLSFRGFLNFFYLKREYVADTITSRQKSLRLIVEKPIKPKPNP